MHAAAPDPLEDLLAEALAAFDAGGQPALAKVLDAHPAERPALERALDRCRAMGLFGPTRTTDFPEQLGEYRLIRRLGSGGMGVVYEAEQQSLQRRVALKIVRPELLYFEGAHERFRREIEAVARLAHPAIVPVLASGEQDGLPFYAMELLDGMNAHDLVRHLRAQAPDGPSGADLRAALQMDATDGTDPFGGPWWQVCARIVHRLTLGVRHAHLRGIVHRDIKPGNVMLTRDGRVVLLDFGIARLARSANTTGAATLTRTGATPGSPAFSSPEQLRADAVDERTDIYSLAATLWSLITLQAPFADVADDARRAGAMPPPLRSIRRDVPSELDVVVQKAMDPDREQRYADVSAFASDLAAVIDRRAIRARPLGPGLRTLRWCQRHRITATALSTALGILLLLPIVFAWRESAINDELEAAVRSANKSLSTTLDAIDGILVTLTHDKLRFVPEAEPMTIGALDRAAGMYASLLQDHPEHVRVRADAARALARLAAVRLRTGDRSGAIRDYEEAIRLAGAGDTVDLLQARADATINLAGLYYEQGGDERRSGLLTAAERDYRLLLETPNRRATALHGLAQIAAQRCDLPEFAQQPGAVLELLSTNVALVREAVAARPDLPEYRSSLARGLDNLATERLRRGDSGDEVVAMLEEALDIARRVPADAAVWPPQPVLESDVLETLGNLRFQRKDPEARATIGQCIDLRERYVARHPADIDLASRLGGAMHNLARTFCADDEPDGYRKALELLDRAIPLQRRALERSKHFARARQYLTLHLRLRGNCLLRLGPPEELEKVATELAASSRDAEHLRATARFWLRAMAMRGEDSAEHKNHAMQSLLAAERAGWRSSSRLDEPVYAPLEGFVEFRALRERLAATK
jgi:serine/threonine protein kinase/tetratricopeptide (TPR) repeat protein